MARSGIAPTRSRPFNLPASTNAVSRIHPSWIAILALSCAVGAFSLWNREHSRNVSARVATGATSHDRSNEAPLAIAEPRGSEPLAGRTEPKPILTHAPQAAPDLRARAAANIRSTYEPLLRRLSLTDGQIDAVLGEILERRMAAIDVRTLGSADRLRIDTQNMLVRQLDDESNQRLRALVPPDVADFLVEMVENSPTLHHAVDLGRSVPGSPYSVQQIVQMARILGDASKANPTHSSVRPEEVDPETGLVEYDRQLIKKAGTFLDPVQLETFAAILAVQRRHSTATHQAQQEILERIVKGTGKP